MIDSAVLLQEAARNGWTARDLRHIGREDVVRPLPTVFAQIHRDTAVSRPVASWWKHHLMSSGSTNSALPQLRSLFPESTRLLRVSPLLDRAILAPPPCVTFNHPHDFPPDVSTRVYLHGPWVRHQFLLLRVVAQAHRAQAFLLSPQGIATLITPVGRHRGPMALFHRLNEHQHQLLSQAQSERSLSPLPRSYKPSFMLGYAQRLSQILPLTQPCLLPSHPTNIRGYQEGMTAAEDALRGSVATLESAICGAA
ncbi:hypothetical protein Cocul_00293 [Corynebacterium oculi]|uniref:Uncharacterized protein n=1 Tax=Corynebacterium oculi TaxID=1544416 RepID=A0A0Q0YFD0_9CORY|nr:hypothetical protein Cocul_00293 [Corynebacterium oculi]